MAGDVGILVPVLQIIYSVVEFFKCQLSYLSTNFYVVNIHWNRLSDD